MHFIRSPLGWLTLSGEMWDTDEVLEMLESLEEGSVIRIRAADTVDDEDEEDDA